MKHALENHGEHYAGVIGLMPGLTIFELVDKGSGSAIIRTNEGLMKRTNNTKVIEAESVVVEFYEEYQAGPKITTESHFLDGFTTSGTGVKHSIVMSGVEAAGLLGFFYRKLNSSNTGSALLKLHQTYFEKQDQ